MPPLCPMCREMPAECRCTEHVRAAIRWAQRVVDGTWEVLGDPDDDGLRRPVVVTPTSPELDKWYPRSVFVTHRKVLDRMVALRG